MESKKLIKKEVESQAPTKKEAKIFKKAIKKAAKKSYKKLNSYGSLSEAGLYESEYVRTILDAVNVIGVKIPDEITAPSYTVQVLTKFTVPTVTGAGGNTGGGFARTLGNTSSGAASGYTPLVASSVANQYSPASAAQSPWAATLVSQAQCCRLVSAKATMTYLGSPNNASGRFLLAFLTPYCPIQPQAANGTWPANVALSGAGVGLNLLQVPNLVDVPASKLYAEVRYLPLDDIARSYEVSGSLAVGTLRAPASNASCTYGSFIGIVDGCPASQAIEVNIWENYEVQSLQSLVNLAQPTVSISDPIEMSVASNIVSSCPTLPAMQSKDQVLASAFASPGSGLTPNMATSVKEPHVVTESSGEPSFMDKFSTGFSGALKLGKEVAPLVESIAALL